MAITVGENSYLTVIDWKAQADLFGWDYSAKTDLQIEQALSRSSLIFIDTTYKFKGEKLDDNQAMRLPTDEVAIADIAKASAQAAWQELSGFLFVDMTTQSANGDVASESKKLSSLSKSVSYAEGTSKGSQYNTSVIDGLMRPYVRGGSFGASIVRV